MQVMVGVSFNLTSDLEFEHKNVSVLGGKVLPHLWSLLAHMQIILGVV